MCYESITYMAKDFAKLRYLSSLQVSRVAAIITIATTVFIAIDISKIID
jgi:hypothetical protein